MRPLASITAEIATLEAVRATTPIQSANADGVSIVNPVYEALNKRLDQLYEQQRLATVVSQQGSNGQAVNGRWERARVTGLGTV